MTEVDTMASEELNKVRSASERSDLRWKRAKRTFTAIMALVGTAFYAVGVSHTQGWGEGSGPNAIPIVRIEGGIAPGSSSGGADALLQSINRAFSSKAKGVILYVDSPGGSPAEAERINLVIDTKKAETGKKVYAVCANMCASAGYMIAMHADEVFAGRYSLVGSIGAILSTWNFSDAINKVGVQHHAYASGNLKAMLNPYIPVKPEDQNKAQALVSDMGKVFAGEVQKLRGTKLSKTADLFTGEVWSGTDAKQHGLIDDIGTLDSVLASKFGAQAKAREMNEGGSKIPFLQSSLDYFAKRLVTEFSAQSAPTFQ